MKIFTQRIKSFNSSFRFSFVVCLLKSTATFFILLSAFGYLSRKIYLLFLTRKKNDMHPRTKMNTSTKTIFFFLQVGTGYLVFFSGLFVPYQSNRTFSSSKLFTVFLLSKGYHVLFPQFFTLKKSNHKKFVTFLAIIMYINHINKKIYKNCTLDKKIIIY